MPRELKTRIETAIGDLVIDRGSHLAEFPQTRALSQLPSLENRRFLMKKRDGFVYSKTLMADILTAVSG